MDEKNLDSPDPTPVASRPLSGLSGDASVACPHCGAVAVLSRGKPTIFHLNCAPSDKYDPVARKYAIEVEMPQFIHGGFIA